MLYEVITVATSFNDKRAAVYDISDGPSYGTELGTVELDRG